MCIFPMTPFQDIVCFLSPAAMLHAIFCSDTNHTNQILILGADADTQKKINISLYTHFFVSDP